MLVGRSVFKMVKGLLLTLYVSNLLKFTETHRPVLNLGPDGLRF